jgi:cytoskeletal protein CcmA (bactofilin family)
MNDLETNVNPENNQELNRLDNSSGNNDSLYSGKGDFSFKGNLTINGIFSGKLIVSGSLTLGVNANVSGEIVVNDLIVFGNLMGSARVINTAIFHTASSFSGALTAREAEFHNGSMISGKRDIGKTTEKGALIKSRKSIFNMEDPTSIPNEMTHSMFKT